MNNTVLKVLAALLFIGSVAVAIVGYLISKAPPKPSPVPTAAAPSPAPSVNVVVAARAITPGQAIGPADLGFKALGSAPAKSFQDKQALLGKVATVGLAVGEVLTADQFASDTLASELRVGERAVAVHVDEVVGVGGFLKPGDHVDVLYYVAANRESGGKTLSQVTVHDARLLSVGDTTMMDIDTAPPANPQGQDKADEAKDKAAALKELRERKANQRSAVLAVPEADATRLMLASNTGVLRLALRPQATVAPDPLSIYPANQRKVASVQTHRVSLPELVQQRPLSDGSMGGDGGGIIIQEGSTEHRLTRNETRIQP